jgi:hypothetical protein
MHFQSLQVQRARADNHVRYSQSHTNPTPLHCMYTPNSAC